MDFPCQGVVSREVCKFFEGFVLPGLIEMADDAIDDAVYTGWILEAAHGSGSAALSMARLWRSGTYLLPVGVWLTLLSLPRMTGGGATHLYPRVSSYQYSCDSRKRSQEVLFSAPRHQVNKSL